MKHFPNTNGQQESIAPQEAARPLPAEPGHVMTIQQYLQSLARETASQK